MKHWRILHGIKISLRNIFSFDFVFIINCWNVSKCEDLE